MFIVLDTNSLIRFFTNDMPERAVLVQKLLKEEANIFIPEVVFPELEYVLSGQYDVSRIKLLTLFQFLVAQRSITVSSQVKDAIEIFGKTKLDMADCIVAAYSLKGSLASFDKELLRVEGVNGFFNP